MKLTIEIELQPNMEELLIDHINEFCNDWFNKKPVLHKADVSGSDKPIVPQYLIDAWKTKAGKWDALDKKIAKFYVDENNEEVESEGDLCDIGEVAAHAFGWL